MDDITWQERFLPKIENDGEHWLWTGGIRDGYGLFWFAGRTQQAHRLSFEHRRGPVPADKVLDHLCRVRHCVNPAHLEPVANRANILRGVGPTALNAAKTHCIRGHEFTPENTRPRAGGGRGCRSCVSSAAA